MQEREYIYCRKCGGEYSANASDYFMGEDDHKFKCCRVQSWLVARAPSRWEGDILLAERITIGDLRRMKLEKELPRV